MPMTAEESAEVKRGRERRKTWILPDASSRFVRIWADEQGVAHMEPPGAQVLVSPLATTPVIVREGVENERVGIHRADHELSGP